MQPKSESLSSNSASQRSLADLVALQIERDKKRAEKEADRLEHLQKIEVKKAEAKAKFEAACVKKFNVSTTGYLSFN